MRWSIDGRVVRIGKGSPAFTRVAIGGVDKEMWRNKSLLVEHAIEFLPAVNEDLAATAVPTGKVTSCWEAALGKQTGSA